MNPLEMDEETLFRNAFRNGNFKVYYDDEQPKEQPKGHNYSKGRKYTERNKNDFYQTPYCLTKTFFDSYISKKWQYKNYTIGDLCCGQKAIGKVLKENGCNVYEEDLEGGFDFFLTTVEMPYGVMNPPFRLFDEWVEKCFDVFTISFALLAPLNYLHGQYRYDNLFKREGYPLDEVWVFSRYPMLTNELSSDGLIDTGMQAYAWFVFTAGKQVDNSVVHWIDINPYVRRKTKSRVNRGKQNLAKLI